MTIKSLDIGPLYRSAKIRKGSIDVDARTVELVFSSETPVRQYFGMEVLDHKRTSVDLDRLNNGAPLLWNHSNYDPDTVIGVVEKAWIDTKDRVGRALVRFASADEPFAEKVFRKVVDRVINECSVGYFTLDKLAQESERVFRNLKWQPFELSIAAVGADPATGIGRSATAQNHPIHTVEVIDMFTRTPNEPAGDGKGGSSGDGTGDDTGGNAQPKPGAQKRTPSERLKYEKELTDNATRKAEEAAHDRVTTIALVCDTAGMSHRTAEFLREGTSIERVREIIHEEKAKRQRGYTPIQDQKIGMSDKEVKQFSIMRAVRSLSDPMNAKYAEDAKFEMECSAAACEKAGVDTRGVHMPKDANWFPGNSGYTRQFRGLGDRLQRLRMPAEVMLEARHRSLNVTTATEGQELVATELLSENFIDLLRNMTAVDKLGARYIDDAVGDIAIPRKTAGANFGWQATETTDVGEVGITFDQITASPKTVGGFIDYTRKFMLQSSLGAEQLVREDFAEGLALALDTGVLYGTGAGGQPLGLTAQLAAAVPAQELGFGAAIPTFDEVVQLETKVATSNALIGALNYLTNPTVRGGLKIARVDPGSGKMVWEGNELNGYPAMATNQVAAGDVFFGNWSDLVIFSWGGVDIVVDPFTKARSGQVRITLLRSMDFVIRRLISFMRGNDAIV